jgi:hypothetical protein
MTPALRSRGSPGRQHHADDSARQPTGLTVISEYTALVAAARLQAPPQALQEGPTPESFGDSREVRF